MRKDIKIDTVIGERMHVLAKTKFFEPLRDVFGYLDGSPYRGSGQNLLLLGYPVHRDRMSALGPGCVKTIFEARARNIDSRNYRRRQ